jgi:TonB family protein
MVIEANLTDRMPSPCPVYLLLAVLAGGPAHAEDPPDEHPYPAVVGPYRPDPVEVLPERVTPHTLPVLQGFMRAAYPEEALELAIEGEVLLGIDVAEDGTVVDVKVLEPAGHGFDGPAEQAAWTMRFAPAVDGVGNPAPAHIQEL